MLATRGQVASVSRKAEQARQIAVGAQRERRPLRSRRFAIPIRIGITGWQLFSGQTAQWKYSWRQVERLPTGRFQFKSGGLVGTFTHWYAINLTEGFNVQQRAGWQGNSINEARTGYPAGFSLQPVGGGTGGVVGCTVVVLAIWMPDTSGTLLPEFTYPNAEDGSCT